MVLGAKIGSIAERLRAGNALQRSELVADPLSTVLCVFALFTLALTSTSYADEPAALDSMVVIANPSVINDTIARRTLRAIFGMRVRNWGDGESITVYVLDDRDPRHTNFCESSLGMLPYNLRRHWDRLIFSGTGRAPIRVSNADEMISLVRNTPGAIGYIREDLVDDSVSVLQIG